MKTWAEMNRAEQRKAWALVETMVATAMQELSDELSSELRGRGVPYKLLINIEFVPLEAVQ